MTSGPVKVALVFGRGPDLAGYRSPAFCGALAGAGVDPVVIDVADDAESAAAGPGDLRCRARELPQALRAAAVVQTFGPDGELGPVWTAAAQGGRPLLHFVQTARAGRSGRRGRGGLAALLRRAAPSRHVTGVLGSSRAALAQALGRFPAATFSRVIAPPVDLPAGGAAAAASPRVTFGVCDPGGADDLRVVLEAVAASGPPDLLDVRLAVAADRLPPSLPRNVTAVGPMDPATFVRSVDALILPADADHLVAPLLAALRAGRTVIVPDGGVLSELTGFGRAGVLYGAGSACDLALKISIVAGASGALPFEFRGGEEAVRRCSPDAVARAFAESFRFALGRAAGG